MRVLITGATGFVGRHLCCTLAASGHAVRAALRVAGPLPRGGTEYAVVGAIGASTFWDEALAEVDCVVHIAGRAHVPDGPGVDPDVWMETNGRGTGHLAQQCVQLGLRRLVYLSSVKVNGDETRGHPYSAEDEPRPQDVYGSSKWLGEKLLWQAVARGSLEAAVVRSPLVYGAGVRANFLRLLRWVDRELPLPLGAVHNARSLVSVWNLCDLLHVLLTHPVATGRTWMVSDCEDLSTPELVRRIGYAMNRRVRLWSVAPALLQLCGTVLGQRAAAARLCDSLTVDTSRTRRELGWSPPLSVDEGLARTCRWYLAERRSYV